MVCRGIVLNEDCDGQAVPIFKPSHVQLQFAWLANLNDPVRSRRLPSNIHVDRSQVRKKYRLRNDGSCRFRIVGSETIKPIAAASIFDLGLDLFPIRNPEFAALRFRRRRSPQDAANRADRNAFVACQFAIQVDKFFANIVNFAGESLAVLHFHYEVRFGCGFALAAFFEWLYDAVDGIPRDN